MRNQFPLPIVITGTTAAGKTSLAFEIASHFQITNIVSCDSRQVYKHLDIVTGKDIPPGFQFHQVSTYQNYTVGFYQGKFKNQNLRLWGFDLASPDQAFSVSNYYQLFFEQILPQINNTFIIVGGTGYYLKGLFSPQETFSISPDNDLRSRLSSLSVIELQSQLQSLNPVKYQSMNNSDQHNPRRLIRAIEVSQVETSQVNSYTSLNPLWIGIKPLTIELIDSLIEKRVKERFSSQGLINEIKLIVENNWANCIPASTLGYPQLIDYFQNKISKEQALSLWTISEKQYARRQITWFKKQPQINWFSRDSRNLVLDFLTSSFNL